MADDDQTIFLNNDESNQVFRICTMHGVDPETANKIAIDLGKADQRSFKGQLETIAKDKVVQGFGAIIVALLGGIVLWVTGAFEKLSGGS